MSSHLIFSHHKRQTVKIKSSNLSYPCFVSISFSFPFKDSTLYLVCMFCTSNSISESISFSALSFSDSYVWIIQALKQSCTRQPICRWVTLFTLPVNKHNRSKTRLYHLRLNCSISNQE